MAFGGRRATFRGFKGRQDPRAELPESGRGNGLAPLRPRREAHREGLPGESPPEMISPYATVTEVNRAYSPWVPVLVEAVALAEPVEWAFSV
jgi:hypothetical protein